MFEGPAHLFHLAAAELIYTLLEGPFDINVVSGIITVKQIDFINDHVLTFALISDFVPNKLRERDC